MKFKPPPPRERVLELLHYDRNSGDFTWVKSQGAAKAGSRACHLNVNGYVQIRIDGVLYLAHRLAWLVVYGEWPSVCIDHIDRERTNNAIGNLRLATHSQNSANRPARSSSRLCLKGVEQRFNRFNARIRYNGKLINLGWFGTAEEASRAYLDAQVLYYGEFAAS